MKNYANCLAIILLSAFMIACSGKPDQKTAKNDSKKSEFREALDQVKSAGKAIKNVSKAESKAKDAQTVIEELQDMEPLESSDLKEWFPEKIGDFHRNKYSSGQMSMLNIVSANASFTNLPIDEEAVEDFEEKTFDLEIMDGAGETGSNLMGGMIMALSFQAEEETDDGYTRKIKKNGREAVESQDNSRKTAGIHFISNDRFTVKLDGYNLTAKELWDIADKLDLKALSKL